VVEPTEVWAVEPAELRELRGVAPHGGPLERSGSGAARRPARTLGERCRTAARSNACGAAPHGGPL
jgi:hypothetical protein